DPHRGRPRHPVEPGGGGRCLRHRAHPRRVRVLPALPVAHGAHVGGEVVSRPLVVAHRCGSGVAPENTLAALRTAVREGADAVEVDVLPSRDGHPVVHHDDRLSRTAGIDAAVWEVDLADLRALDVGRWFAPGFEGERIPTLEDVVAAETSRPVYVFTPNRPAELRVALTVGADAVITDHVAVAVELRAQLARGERG